MEVILWALIFLVIYTYVGYGLILYIIIQLKRLFKKAQAYTGTFYEPEVSLVIPAFNEEEFITQKVNNSMEIDYPKEKLKIIFITDGSTDNTVDILSTFKGIEILHENKRAGKTAAENRAMKFVDTPIVVFCDANTILNPECIRELVKHYKNPEVGGVAGEKKIMTKESDNASSAGEGIYWKYESTLKKWDSELYTVVGAAGELISFRSELVEDLEEDTILDDFVQSLRICEKGYRVLYEPGALAMETASENVREELKRKIRIAAGGWQGMSRLTYLLNPIRNPLLTFQYVSHRVLRWSVAALALPLILLLNIWIIIANPTPAYVFLMCLQVAFYFLAGIGWFLEQRKMRLKILFIPYYFSMMNYAVFAGFIRWIKGKQEAVWEKANRSK